MNNIDLYTLASELLDTCWYDFTDATGYRDGAERIVSAVKP